MLNCRVDNTSGDLSGKSERTDPRVKRTRQMLQQALSELMKEQTFSAITVQDIATRAGLNRATFYAHFADKYALLNTSIHESFGALLAERLSESPLFTEDSLRRLTLTVCEYLGGFLEHCVPFRQDATDRIMVFMQVQTSIYEVLLGWLSADGAARATSWAIFGSVLQWGHEGRTRPPEALAADLLPLLLSGLRAYLVEPESILS